MTTHQSKAVWAFAQLVRTLAMGVLLFWGWNSSAQYYEETNLVSDVPGAASATDTNLVGAWGIVASATSPWWVNGTMSGRSLIINGAGQPQSLVVTIPPGTNPPSATGIAFNGSGAGFEVSNGVPSVFLFCTLNGTIAGWSPGLSNKTEAVITVDNPGAGYTRLALAQDEGMDYLYAVDFYFATDMVNTSGFHGLFGAIGFIPPPPPPPPPYHHHHHGWDGDGGH